MGTIDKILKRRISKKLIVFITATYLVISNVLTSGDWVTIAAVYLGTQGVIDAVAKLRN
jgi:hypothetical protein